MRDKETMIFKRKPEIATGVVIENDAGEVFLGKSTKFGGLWIVPGGHLEHGETLKECVIREIGEELGIKLDKINFLNIQESINPPDYEDPEAHLVFINFTARIADTGEEVILNQGEYSDHCFISPEKALEELELNDSTRALIKYYLDHKKGA